MPRGLILVARHPRPRIASRICYGRTDVPLAEPPELGAATLIAAASDPIERIVRSPLGRALLVAQAAAPAHTPPRRPELGGGAWDNHPGSAIPRPETAAGAADPLRYRPGGGESVDTVLRRVRRAWTGIASSEANTLVLTHAGPIRCLLHIGRGIPILDAIQASIAYGEVLRFE